MNKKTILIFSIIIVLGLLTIRALYSPNFLFPNKVDVDSYSWLFDMDHIKSVTPVYSFRNLKNEVTYFDIDKKIRCRFWKFNNFSSIPQIDTSAHIDTIIISNYVDNYYGSDPTLKVFNQQIRFLDGDKYLQIREPYTIHKSNSTDKYLDFFANIFDLGIYNQKDICEVKFSFNQPTNVRLIFFKGDKDYYILMYYGINGYMVDKDTEIFNDMKTWFSDDASAK